MKRSKCILATTSVEYLGLHPSPAKVRAIQEAPAPTNVTELRAFLGLVNYYLPNLSTILFPLHQLLCNGAKWSWNQNQQVAFDKTKELLQSSSILTVQNRYYYASPYGVGAVLAHVMPDSSERPIAFISRTLTPAERNYSQLEKEAFN